MAGLTWTWFGRITTIKASPCRSSPALSCNHDLIPKCHTVRITAGYERNSPQPILPACLPALPPRPLVSWRLVEVLYQISAK